MASWREAMTDNESEGRRNQLRRSLRPSDVRVELSIPEILQHQSPSEHKRKAEEDSKRRTEERESFFGFVRMNRCVTLIFKYLK